MFLASTVRTHSVRNRYFSVLSIYRDLISQHTEVTNLCGLKLHLITPNIPIYYCHDEALLPFDNPWWGFCWPGGHALTRYIRSAPSIFNGKSVLDIGCGCASSSIAAALAGATKVTANDIDPMVEAALELNMERNFIPKDKIQFLSDDVVHNAIDFFLQYDIIVCGDMLYDGEFSHQLMKTLVQHPCVIFGDVGRTYCPKHISADHMLSKLEYNTDGFPYMYVFKLSRALLAENNIQI